MTGLYEAFRALRLALVQSKIPFAIGGSWASTAYGEPRQTNDIDLIAGLDLLRLDTFLERLHADFYRDRDTAHDALRLGRPFNVIHTRFAYKFDIFPANDEHAITEIQRCRFLSIPGLDSEPVPVVSPEDTILAKLRWYRQGGHVSSQQWRDVMGVLRAERGCLDEGYLDSWAARLGVTQLLNQARAESN